MQAHAIFGGKLVGPAQKFGTGLGYRVASIPGQIFAFISDLAKIRPGNSCMRMCQVVVDVYVFVSRNMENWPCGWLKNPRSSMVQLATAI